MFIKKVLIKNYRLFSSTLTFELNNLNIPNNEEKGSGLNIFVGENGCGKSSLINALVLPLLQYKADNFNSSDFNDPTEKANIEIYSAENFLFKGTMPNQSSPYQGKGFAFVAGIRERVNDNFLSSVVVHDQKYIKADGQVKPREGSPDLRLSVNNPWSGPRFNENDILFLDEGRTYQIRSGMYSTTRFDRLMDDFDLQYIKRSTINDLDASIKAVVTGIENEFLTKSIEVFEDLSREKLCLSFINNWAPHDKAFFCIKKSNNQQISIDKIGSGYETIFSLLYSFYLAQQSNKQLIILIDEPELHLHPTLQEKFINVLLDLSKTAQIFLTTHSPLFIKQIMENEKVQVTVLKKTAGSVSTARPEHRVLPYLSSNEINFVAFNLPTEEYHNELYEELYIRDSQNRRIPLSLKDYDLHFFQREKSESPSFRYNGQENAVSIHTYLRTQIHHRSSAGKPDIGQIQSSIEKMRSYF